jgi:predicted O-linked N-acetylglucosamine transferase (SPINDLY family)
MTKPSSKPVTIFGNRWLSFSPPLVAGVSRLDNLEIQRERNRFPHKVICGTFAREEKFNSPEFLQALVTILKRTPSSHFVYTGRQDSHQVRVALSNPGLLDRATYIGWVDTNLMSQVIDVFLETFPFGCGVTGAQALELGTEVISLWGGDTLPTYYFETYEEARSFKKSWRVCASINEYVEAAINSLNSVSNQSTDNQVFQDSLNLSDLDARKPEQLLRLFGLPTQAPGP